MKKSFSLKGFTLLELIVVIAIIGILAVIVLPSFLSSLAKARDAKKMTELRGVQSFLTLTGIDTVLRYPASETELLAWMARTGNRAPAALTNAGLGKYHYAPFDCDSNQQVTVGGTLTTAGTCSSYQLWVELEKYAPALDLDADLVPAGTACPTANNQPCAPADKIGSSVAFTPVTAATTVTTPVIGNTESCQSNTAVDCVFDLLP